MSLGNIPKATRAKLGRRAFLLVAYIPSPKFEDAADEIAENKTQENGLPGIFRKRIYHRCLSILTEPLRNKIPRRVLDADGYWRLVLYILMVYIADMEEQWLIACVANFSCVHCLARSGDLGKTTPCAHRTGQSILDQIAEVHRRRGEDASVWSFVLGCRQEGLNGVAEPFWKHLPYIDICEVLSQDVLHSYHKFFFDHPVPWNKFLMTPKEMDNRLQSQPQAVGMRSFPKGISHISQMSGKEHRALERTHLSIVAGAPGITPDVVSATRALMDYIYLAQYPRHSERSLEDLEKSVKLFHEEKDVWLRKEARRSKENGNVIAHLDIPKAHTPLHGPACIRLKGTTDNYTAETPEHLHIQDLKSAYPFTNHRDFETQMIRHLLRRESVYNFDAFQAYIDRVWPEEVDPVELEHAATGDEVAVRRTKRKKTPRMENNQIMLNIKPDRTAMEVNTIATRFNLPFLYRDILRYINLVRSSNNPNLPPLTSLPSAFERLHVWFSIRVLAPRPNTYYSEEWWRIRAQPALDEKPARYDPVLLIDKEGASTNGLKGQLVPLSCL